METVLTGLDKHTAASEGGESGQTGWGRITPVKNGTHISNVSLWVEWASSPTNNCVEEGSTLPTVYSVSVLPDEEGLLAGSSACDGKG